jgi:hypothetical protein
VRLDTRSRQEIIKADGEDYRKAGKKGRGEILERSVLVTGLNRDRLAARLRNCGKDGAAEAGGEAGKGKRKAWPGGKRGGRHLSLRGAACAGSRGYMAGTRALGLRSC